MKKCEIWYAMLLCLMFDTRW